MVILTCISILESASEKEALLILLIRPINSLSFVNGQFL